VIFVYIEKTWQLRFQVCIYVLFGEICDWYRTGKTGRFKDYGDCKKTLS
jgi:hypothetical protein